MNKVIMKYLFLHLLGLPLHWDTMSGDAICVSITLNAGTKEYTEIQNLFGQSCKQNIIKVDCGFFSEMECFFFFLSKPQNGITFPLHPD